MNDFAVKNMKGTYSAEDLVREYAKAQTLLSGATITQGEGIQASTQKALQEQYANILRGVIPSVTGLGAAQVSATKGIIGQGTISFGSANALNNVTSDIQKAREAIASSPIELQSNIPSIREDLSNIKLTYEAIPPKKEVLLNFPSLSENERSAGRLAGYVSGLQSKTITITINEVRNTSSASSAALPKYRPEYSCFIAGTMVDTPDGQRAIETIKKGDAVYAYDTQTGELIPTRVDKLIRNQRSDVITLHFESGYSVSCSPNHRILTDCGEYTEAEKLLGANVRTTGGVDRVYAVVAYTGRHTVYNLEVENPEHNYVISGHVVHNAKAWGGDVNAGQAYMVGEKGPEMFVPRSAGQIVPNSQVGGGAKFYAPVTFQVRDASSINALMQEVAREIA